MIFNSIRWRLQAWNGLILLGVLTGFGLTAYHVARDNQLRRIDQDLGQRLFMTFRVPPPALPPRGHGGPGMPTAGPEQAPAERPPADNASEPPGVPWGDGEPRLQPDVGNDGPRGGPPREDRHRGHPGIRDDPAWIRARLSESVQRAASTEAGQTNAYYFVMWQCEGGVLAMSTNTPAGIARPLAPEPEAQPRAHEREEGKASEKGPGESAKFVALRTRGVFREIFTFTPFGDCLLVGRSMAPDLAAMRRLALWLVAAGAAVLVVGLAGGWWLASRASLCS